MKKIITFGIIGVITISLVLLILAFCAEKQSLHINENVKNILTADDIEKSKIYMLADPEDDGFVELYDIKSDQTTDQELKKYIDELLSAHKSKVKSYVSSDRYILDYYGVETEEEFLSLCEIRLKQIKKYGNKQAADNVFLDKIAEKCRFIVNRREAINYSEKHGISYNEGVKEIKRYLLVGAYTNGFEFNEERYAEFCSMNGYDSTNKEDFKAKYDYLKSNTVIDFCNLISAAVLYNINYDNDTEYTVEVYESSNVYAIDFSKAPSKEIDKETQDAILSRVMHTGFSNSLYGNGNHLYQTVLIVKGDGKICAKIMIDEVNGFIKWQTSGGEIVIAELDEQLFKLVKKTR